MNIDVYEAAVLSLTLRADYAAQVFSKIQPEDFSSDLQAFAVAAHDLLRENKAVDVLTVADRLESEGIENAGELLAQIVEQSGKPSIENLDDYCGILSNRGLKRNLYTATLTARQILDEETDPATAQEKIVSEFERLQGRKADEFLFDMRKASKLFYEEMDRRNTAGGELIGLSTGFKHLDERMNGMREGDLIIVAGRPSMGKTTFAMNIVEHNAARKNLPCLVFSMEMSASQIVEKMTASLGGINLGSLRRGTLNEEEWTKFGAASQMVQKANLYIDERGGLSVAQMRARCHEIKRKAGGLSLIMVDYLQLMDGKAENRTQEITKITGGLKGLAKEFQCPVIALSQLNRGVESRSDKRPLMSDLRESGSIEQDADVIIFPFRAGYYENPDDPDPTTEIIFGKIRMGERGSESLEFQGQFSRFKSTDARVDFEAIRRAKEEAEREAKKANRNRGGMPL
ncbi:replicative DNA helicase [Marinobacter nauticus]|uniref:Replicative DNA helicase n=1 Tax=Marinobacter nauticus TaxID=2743 RepID=A0A1M2V0W3_MARNT|nr:replicative DNA helicase [Marinobacter nauticus]OJT01212.1 replicative DNA helicase [Marinobacter nauticus]